MSSASEIGPDDPASHQMPVRDRLLRLEIWRHGDREHFAKFEEVVTTTLKDIGAKLDLLVQSESRHRGKSDVASAILHNVSGPLLAAIGAIAGLLAHPIIDLIATHH